jgi:hypothetical protein
MQKRNVLRIKQALARISFTLLFTEYWTTYTAQWQKLNSQASFWLRVSSGFFLERELSNPVTFYVLPVIRLVFSLRLDG